MFKISPVASVEKMVPIACYYCDYSAEDKIMFRQGNNPHMEIAFRLTAAIGWDKKVKFSAVRRVKNIQKPRSAGEK